MLCLLTLLFNYSMCHPEHFRRLSTDNIAISCFRGQIKIGPECHLTCENVLLLVVNDVRKFLHGKVKRSTCHTLFFLAIIMSYVTVTFLVTLCPPTDDPDIDLGLSSMRSQGRRVVLIKVLSHCYVLYEHLYCSWLDREVKRVVKLFWKWLIHRCHEVTGGDFLLLSESESEIRY